MKKKITLAVFVLLLTAFVFAQDVKTSSPNGENIIAVTIDEGVSFTIISEGLKILDNSKISLFIDNVDFFDSVKVVDVTESSVSATVEAVVPNTFATLKEEYNQTKITFSNNAGLELRAYNDGVAYRWFTDFEDAEIFIRDEQIDLSFEKDYKSYFPEPNGIGFFSHHENLFNYQKISKVKTKAKGAVPMLVELDDDKYMLLTDVNLEQYPGLWLTGVKEKEAKLEAIFPKYPAAEKLIWDRNMMVSKTEDYIAKVKGKSELPWRAFVLTDTNGLLTSSMLYLLATPNQIEDTSWIKPGLVAWDWWNNWNLTDVDFKPGIDQRTYMHYIDFASENGLPYIILDEGWSVNGPKNLLKVIDAIDMPALSAYAESKNVGLVLWMTSVSLINDYDRAFEQFAEWNVKGLKVDFLQRDDQQMMEFCYKLSKTAADYKMLVNVHGGPKPVGISRTYPNFITVESVMGLEQNKWAGRIANPDMAVLIPFNRMLVGPMDYTPGAMVNKQKSKYRISYTAPMSLGTRAHQLAMYVVYISPMQMLADTPSNYRKNPESLNFLKDVPVVWHETVPLKNKVGEYVAVARKFEDKWYIGAMTNWSERKLSTSLDFLGEGDWEITLYEDGPRANREASDLTISTKSVNKNDALEINMAKGGGFAAVLERK